MQIIAVVLLIVILWAYWRGDIVRGQVIFAREPREVLLVAALILILIILFTSGVLPWRRG